MDGDDGNNGFDGGDDFDGFSAFDGLDAFLPDGVALAVALGLLALCLVAGLAVAAGALWWFRSRPRPPGLPRRPVSAPSGPPDPPVAASPRPGDRGRVGETLRAYQAAGQHRELLRFLDGAMPEWPVGASLTEVARELLELERGLAVARDRGVSEPVVDRLARETETLSGTLWDLADRVAATAAYAIDSPRLRQELAREDERLDRLLPAIREARAGLAELTLAGAGGRDQLRRAEGRFRALAETARALQDLDAGVDGLGPTDARVPRA